MIVCSALLFASCSSGDNKPSPDNETASSDCLKGFNYEYEKLLTKQDLSKHLQIDDSSFKTEVRPNKDNYGSCQYKWDSNRPEQEMELLGQIIKVADPNIVEIKNLNFYSQKDLELYNHKSFIDLFEMGYKPLSDEEYNSLKSNLEKEFANNKVALDNAVKLLDIRKSSSYQVVDNLGTRAFWKWNDLHGIDLTVLAGSAKFSIASKTSGNAQESLATAVKLAQEVLAKCKN